MGAKEFGPGEECVISALEAQGFQVGDAQDACFSFTDADGTEYKVTVEADAEDEEFGTDKEQNAKEIDDAGKQMKMADKATEDDPNTIQSKRNLTQQVGNTYNDLTNGLRKVTSQLKR